MTQDLLTRSPADGAGPSRPASKNKEPSTDKYKIQIQLNGPQKDRLFELKELIGAESAAQVVREALRAYEFFVDEVLGNGSEVFVQNPETREVTKVKLL